MLRASSKASCNLETQRLLWFLFAGSRGGSNRLRLISSIKEQSLNANQLTKKLRLDYKAIQHHLKVLEKNNLIIRMEKKYGSTYFISPLLENCMVAFDEILIKLKK